MYENYNSIGKWRTTENGVNVDSSVNTNILDEGALQTTQPVVALNPVQ